METILVAAIAAVVGLATTLATVWVGKRFGVPTDLEARLIQRLKAANQQLEQDLAAAQTTIATMKAAEVEGERRIGELEDRVDFLERQNGRLQDRIAHLEAPRA